ncbi:MAG: T9SS type A sorting domain-containing protein [Lentimicrobiaceae bacterium]|nr:T9SS type A sorting domain-containing protein [Lentimicrobiaceae bacterium]
MKKQHYSLKLGLLLLVTISITNSFAQISAGEIPPSFYFETENQSLSSTINLSVAIDIEALKAEDMERKQDNLPPRTGFIIPVNFTTENSGEWTTLPNGEEIWRLSIITQDAVAIMLTYDKFDIPLGGKLFIYNNKRSMVLGAYTEENNPKRVEYATEYLAGEQITLEYIAPPSENYNTPIIISGVVYGYSSIITVENDEDGGERIDFRSSEPCEVDVNCSEGDNWQDQKKGVVRIHIPAGGGYYYICSGSVVNNTAQDFDPLVLSAYHCFEDATPAQVNQSVFYFNYERPACKSGNGSSAQSVTGAQLLVNMPLSGGSDGSLLRLNSHIPEIYHAYYNGWDRRNIAATNGVSIHHPDGDYKKISTFTTTLFSSNVSISGLGTSASNAMWRVTWAQTANGHGVTEGGSSGSPIFNQNKLIVGTLTGGGSECEHPNWNDYYGKLWYHWNQHNNPIYHMQPYLDPINSDVEYLEGAYDGDPVSYTIFLSANPEDGGSVSGGGDYYQGTNVTAKATPNPNYNFVNWTKNDTVVSSNSTYIFKATQDVDLVANFTLKTYTVSVSANPEDGGAVSGNGVYEYGENVTVTATPYENFVFLEWTKGNSVVSTDSSYTFQVAENVTLIANFQDNIGIKEHEQTPIFALSPNPAGNLLHLIRKNTDKAKIDIYSSIGLLIKSFEINEIETSIDISALSSGIYFIQLTDCKNFHTQRFIKE